MAIRIIFNMLWLSLFRLADQSVSQKDEVLRPLLFVVPKMSQRGTALWTGEGVTGITKSGGSCGKTGFMGGSSRAAKYQLGQVVRHRIYEFRGVVFDVDPDFQNTEEWYESIPEDARPSRDQPFYHLLAENETSYYVAYVSEQNLVPDETGDPVDHPEISQFFGAMNGGQYQFDRRQAH